MLPAKKISATRWKLPPLILHPFADNAGPRKLVESSRASLMLQGLIPKEDFTVSELDAALLDGRFCEIRMLYYVGKDLLRWIEQCMEMTVRDQDLHGDNLEVQSFAALLVEDTPPAVKAKLVQWGVVDYKSIFSRAIGLNMVFAEVPEKGSLAESFIRNYYRYADHCYACHQSMKAFGPAASEDFDFDLFASGEYSRLLEREWQSN